MGTEHGLRSQDLAAAVDALQDCAEAVTACGSAMLGQEGAQTFAPVVSRGVDCADVATATRNALTRRSGFDTSLLSAQLEACLLACERSYEQCSKRAQHHAHCRMCADVTRHRADTCRQVSPLLHG